MLTTPTSVIDAFADRLAEGDLDGAVALYDPEATFAPQPGTQVTGVDAIRAALEPFLALQPKLSGEIVKVLAAGDVALVVNRWSLSGSGPDGAPVEMQGTSADVLRRRGDGTWRLLVDDPWGAAA